MEAEPQLNAAFMPQSALASPMPVKAQRDRPSHRAIRADSEWLKRQQEA
jgi:hypothetical protein